MKLLINIVCIFLVHFPSFTMEENPREEFKNDFLQRIAQISDIDTKLQFLQQNEHFSYFGKDVNLQQFNEIKALFSHCKEHLKYYFKDFDIENISSRRDIEFRIFPMYCQIIYLIKGLHTAKSSFVKDSQAERDTIAALHSLSIFEDYFADTEKYLSSFLKIEPVGKKDNIRRYSVTINFYEILNFQKKQAMNILNTVNLINIQQLQLPKKYKAYLDTRLKQIKEDYAISIRTGFNLNVQHMREMKSYDLSANSQTETLILNKIDLGPIMNNYQSLNFATKLVFDPLNLSFENEDGSYCRLSSEEKERSCPLLQALFDKRLNEASVTLKKESSILNKKQSTSKKKNQSQQQKKPTSQNTPIKKKSQNLKNLPNSKAVIQTENISPGMSQNAITFTPSPTMEKIVSSDMSQNAPILTPSPIMEKIDSPDMSQNAISPTMEKIVSSDMSQNAPILTPSPTMEKIILEEELPQTSAVLVHQWLEEIMAKSRNKDGQYSAIYNKAYSCQTTLTKNPAILEEIQQAAQNLALYLQKIEQGTISNKNFLCVPQQLAPDFDYFMYTPICYLKGLRMGFITTFLETLGIEVDKTRNGSRVHFKFKNYKTSIHIHDKNNGIVDSGAISSLRKFLIDMEWKTKD